jgi:DNA-binding transcriptional MerR regulator
MAKITPEKQREYNQKYALKRKEWRLRKRYGINLSDYHDLLAKQNARCAICNVASNKENWQNDTTQHFDVDHNHKTGKIRGLLCRRCNICIGYIDDCLPLLAKIKAYLEKGI